LPIGHVLIIVALVAAVAALLRARQVSKRLDRLNESYWELRYECGQLRSRMDQLEGAPGLPARSEPQVGSSSFVPLSSLKR
jgi:hypothetical protein